MFVHTPNDLAAIVKQGRLDAKLTQAQLAERIGVRRLWVVKFEQGKAEAEVGLVLRALRVLGLSLQVTSAAAGAPPAALDPLAPSIDLDALLGGGER